MLANCSPLRLHRHGARTARAAEVDTAAGRLRDPLNRLAPLMGGERGVPNLISR